MKRYVIVSGLPASGKSTLGAAVATALGLPLLDKDDLLEALFDTLGVGDAGWRNQLSRAADEILKRQALRSQGAVIASWWRHPSSRFESGTPTDWLPRLSGDLVELHCKCHPQVAVDRFFARERHSGHLDSSKSKSEELARFQELSEYGALGVGRIAEVDTEHEVELGVLLRQIGLAFNRPNGPGELALV
jgi:hypothetical protein